MIATTQPAPSGETGALHTAQHNRAVGQAILDRDSSHARVRARSTTPTKPEPECHAVDPGSVVDQPDTPAGQRRPPPKQDHLSADAGRTSGRGTDRSGNVSGTTDPVVTSVRDVMHTVAHATDLSRCFGQTTARTRGGPRRSCRRHGCGRARTSATPDRDRLDRVPRLERIGKAGENPGEATLHVLRGRVRLACGDDSWEGSKGDLIEVPNARHSLYALEDSVVLLTVAKLP